MKHRYSSRILFIAIFFLFSQIVFSNTYTVSNTNDAGAGSLREAIGLANSNPGPDNIYFNIPLADAGYNAGTGTWTINVVTLWPMVLGGYTNIDATSQTTNQGNTNLNGPEIAIQGNGTLDYSFNLVSPNNTVKGFIVNGFNYGILVYNSTATGNQINGNYIGTNYNGTIAAAITNQYGIALSGSATTTTIMNNLISGNAMGGIGLTASNSNIFKGNKIGTDRTGMNKIPNPYGIAIDNSSNNTVGGNSAATRNIISGNISAGIVINGTVSSGNIITGNYIGTNVNGTDSLPNDNGIILAGSNSTTIGGSSSNLRNIISGNYLAGIVLNGTGTRLNSIKGNFIGTAVTGMQHLSNHTGIIVKAQSNLNTIGGTSTGERNVISGNIEIGVYIEASDSNVVVNNFLGPDSTGMNAFKIGDSLVQANGIELNTVAKRNTIGGSNANTRNIISGNRVYGLIYYGNCSYNNTSGNYIGTNVTGNAALPNATGICVDAGSNHNQMNNNLLSGNKSYGIFFVTTNTYYNEFKGNIVGLNAAGTDTIPNDIGVVLVAGTRYNQIGGLNAGERNIISGNRYDGIEIADNGTKFNQIIGNYIGTDITGTIAKPNENGIGMATNPKFNTIDQNVISGNDRMGIIIFEFADSNTISNNKIGSNASGTAALSNHSCGIVLLQGASNNIIGPNNTIAFNDSVGVLVVDNNTIQNRITENSIHDNGFFGIDLAPYGPTPNDAGDADSGPNLLMNYPVISTSVYDPANSLTWLTGTIDYSYQSPLGIKIEVFKSDNDPFGFGEGEVYLGSAIVDASGNWATNFPGVTQADNLTATAIDLAGNTSEFSANTSIVVGIKENTNSNFSFFPNPVIDNFTINYSSAKDSKIEINLYEPNGKLIGNLFSGDLKTGNNRLNLSINKFSNLTTGIYFLNIISNEGKSEMRKISVIK
ncbi:MAG: right-handed parallel beta-helix repeat-containing protein [Bacteroidetes bacterium]|nr:right-handed parallel beta-helix repeat-containing protein [Bacteroidota bacterium]